MKKKEKKSIHYNATLSKWVIGLSASLFTLMLSNAQLITISKSLEARILINTSIVLLFCSFFCGLINVMVISFDYDLPPKKFGTLSISKDKKLLHLQVSLQALSVMTLLFPLLDSL